MQELLDRSRCLLVLIDIQPLFLSWRKGEDSSLLQRLRQYVLLSRIHEIPTLVTLEEPLEKKGGLDQTLREVLTKDAVTLTKQTFDLCSEPKIAEYIDSVERDQVVIAGCETDVCVLQSCFGLLARGKKVFLLVDGMFTSSTQVQPAIDRMVMAGAQPMTYKSFFYELLRSVDRGTLPERVAVALRRAEANEGLLDPEDVPEP